jgi:hypothetical protein
LEILQYMVAQDEVIDEKKAIVVVVAVVAAAANSFEVSIIIWINLLLAGSSCNDISTSGLQEVKYN